MNILQKFGVDSECNRKIQVKFEDSEDKIKDVQKVSLLIFVLQ